MANHQHSIFAASRAAAQKIMDEGTQVLRYETTEDARIRSCLKHSSAGALTDGEIDEMLRSYHRIQRIRASLTLSS